ncbi:MAG: YdbL family protein [Nitrosomonas sp.]|nr:YdbL family protein [Nitrosomonas sp.]
MHLILLRSLLLLYLLFLPFTGYAQNANIEINTPAIANLKQSMQQRHAQLQSYYDNGAVGLTRDGSVALRDANSVPLAARQSVNALVAAENQDRNALYHEIARANNHPEWERDIRNTFSQRWISLARPSWWYQQADGSWRQK